MWIRSLPFQVQQPAGPCIISVGGWTRVAFSPHKLYSNTDTCAMATPKHHYHYTINSYGFQPKTPPRKLKISIVNWKGKHTACHYTWILWANTTWSNQTFSRWEIPAKAMFTTIDTNLQDMDGERRSPPIYQNLSGNLTQTTHLGKLT